MGAYYRVYPKHVKIAQCKHNFISTEHFPQMVALVLSRTLA